MSGPLAWPARWGPLGRGFERLRSLASPLAQAGQHATATVDQAIVSGSNFASSVILARHLDTAEFGLFVLATAVIYFAVAIQNGLTLQPLVVTGAGLDDRAFRRYLRANIRLQWAFIAASTVLVAAAALLWEPLRPVALPLTVATALLHAQEFCRRTLYTRTQMRAALANNALSYGLQALLLALATWLVGVSLEEALWVMAFTSLLAVLLGVWQLRRFASADSDPLRAVARGNFRIGRWTTVSVGLAALSFQAYPTIITGLAGLAGTAGFGVVRQLLGPLHLLTYPLESYYLPRAARALDRDGSSGLRRVLWQAASRIAPPFMLYVLILAAVPALVLEVVYGEQYAAYADVLRPFALATLIHLLVDIPALEINARRLQRYLLVGEVWFVGVLYTAGVYLIAQFGLIGTAMTEAIGLTGQFAIFAVVLFSARLADRRATAPPSSSQPGQAPGDAGAASVTLDHCSDVMNDDPHGPVRAPRVEQVNVYSTGLDTSGRAAAQLAPAIAPPASTPEGMQDRVSTLPDLTGHSQPGDGRTVQRRSTLRTLVYHRLEDPAIPRHDLAPDPVSASPALFERHIQHLARFYSPVGADEVHAALAGRHALPRRAVLVTFDDGYRCFLDIAWPILKRYGVPAVLFVPTAFVDNPSRVFWWDAVWQVLARTDRARVVLPDGTRRSLQSWDDRVAASRVAAELLKRLSPAARVAALQGLAEQLAVGPTPTRAVLSWAELRQLADDGVTIAAHSQTHALLDQLDEAALAREVDGCRDDLVREMGTCPRLFAYPNGNFDERTVRALERAGFESGFTTIPGPSRLGTADPRALRRDDGRAGLHRFALRLAWPIAVLRQWRHPVACHH